MLGADAAARATAFDEGAAPILASAVGGRIAGVLTAERTPAYLTILYGLLLRRRDHELEPAHDDLYRLVEGPLGRRDAYDPQLFAQDLEQLVGWGAVARITEAQRLRSYRDNRRERHRYRLEDDAVALLAWLEERLAAKLDGRIGDSRDRLTDVLGHLREARRVLDAWRGGERDPDAARRALHLVEAVGDAIDEVAAEMLTFRAEMLAFASRPYDLVALRAILDWLERYVAVYVGRVEELRTEIEARLRELAAPRHRLALDECRQIVVAERAAMPRAFRSAGAVLAPVERLDAHAAFFASGAAGGRLAALGARIDESLRAVVQKVRHHLREIERRSARLGDLRAAIRAVALGPERDPRLGELVNGLIASAHARFDARAAAQGQRAIPPLPRAHARTSGGGSPRPLARKRGTMESARALATKRLAELAAWVDQAVLIDAPRVLLSAHAPTGSDAPRRWLDVARARHLGGGRALARIGISIEADSGEATVGDATVGMAVPDCWIERARATKGGT